MTQPEFREQLRQWVDELAQWRGAAPDVAFNGDDEAHFTIVTTTTRYGISAHRPRADRGWRDEQGYLGCIAGSRDQLGGNDLPDGSFNKHTWEKILHAIVRYEMWLAANTKDAA